MGPSPYTTTYTLFGETYRYTYNYDYPTGTNTYDFGGYNPFNNNTVRAVTAGYIIALGVIFGLHVIALIVVAIVYFKRQKRRQAWYGPMAEHYRNGGPPPWAAGGGGSVKPPLAKNDYNSYTGGPFKAPLIQNSNNPYPPTPSQPQYDTPQRYSAFTPYEVPAQPYKGY